MRRRTHKKQKKQEDQKEWKDQRGMADPQKVFSPSPFSCNGMWDWPFQQSKET